MLEDTFADIIGKARFGHDLSLSEVAQHTKITPSYLKQLEEGLSLPTLSDISALASCLGLHAEKLSVIAEGGWEPHVADMECLKTIRGHIGTYPVNGYLAIDHGSAVLFDTAVAPEQVLYTLEHAGVHLVAIFITHAHADHIGGVEKIREATKAPIYLHTQERRGQDICAIASLEAIEIDGFHVRPLMTPGHTPGGTSFLLEIASHAMVFCGDALFAGSIGRAYMPASYATLRASVHDVLLSLPGETLLFPGHGPATTVCEERLHNPFF